MKCQGRHDACLASGLRQAQVAPSIVEGRFDLTLASLDALADRRLSARQGRQESDLASGAFRPTADWPAIGTGACRIEVRSHLESPG